MRKLRMRRRAVFGLGILVMLTVTVLGSSAEAQSLAPLVNPVNGHFYEAVPVSVGIDWFGARDAAELRSFSGVQGHLVTITSAQEDSFIATNFPEAFPVIPSPRPPGCADPTTEENTCGYPYWFGGFQPPGSLDEPEGNWEWVTGEPFVYTNWHDGEPNDFQEREEDCLHPHTDGSLGWNDSLCDDRRVGGYVVEYDVATFPDVQSDHWAWQFVEAIFSAGLTSGFPDGTYRPDNPVTRAEMAVFIKKGIHGSTYTPPTPDGSHPFDDISGHWAEAWIEDLFDEGFTSGFPDGTYRPDSQVTRAEMAVFLKKAIHGSEYTSPMPDGSHPFSDISGHWAEAWIEDLFDEGITSGFPDGTYRPENQVTRAEIAVFLVRTFNLPLAESTVTVIQFGDAFGNFYSPAQVTIGVGDTVEWQGDFSLHPLVSEDGLWMTVNTSSTFSFTFTSPGTYRFYCFNHGAPDGEGMAGQVVVSSS